ncbi:hypothetical protein QGX11_gp102 [Pseudomonas phage PPSC2]|uniref:Uncharacterized protein n=1 Tax=Pseudomonas phage PPSC2 TaxID=2041350 RepID=A0A2R2YAS3_9CAUD|nr:hypothetical protein QGX11_gp102 [Pseudomonas phage PPSC2]ATN92865.1 hypothetical protein PPSC2_102 [Pseudomonas phage PPSC2]
MAAIRRPPKVPVKPKAKPVVPLHQQILGKHQIELDNVEDLRYKLELAYDADSIEYDSYLECHDVLDARESKALEALEKSRGKKLDKTIPVRVKVVQTKPWKPWQVKLFMVITFLIFFKVFTFKP